jgi:FkbM family methyltransferase
MPESDVQEKVKTQAAHAPKRSLRETLDKLRRTLEFARARGGSFTGAARLFYYAGLKPSLVSRGVSAFAPERILRIPFAVSQNKGWEVCVRDNQLDLVTLAEFFSPKTFMTGEFPDIEPSVIYDIGANIGVSSLFFAAKYPRARICGFEPLPSNYEICSMNYRNLNQAQVFPWAVGSTSCSATFEFNVNDNRGGRLATSPAGNRQTANQRIPVEVLSLADLIQVKKLERPDFLKIDVEGAELEVLSGIGENVSSIRAIHLETHGQEIRAECRRWLQQRGFSVVGEREEQPGFGAIWCRRD